MSITLSYNDFSIDIFDDLSYPANSKDSPTQYDIVYNSDHLEDYYYPSKHGIKVSKNGQLIKTAILLGAGGAAGVGTDSALVDDGNLIISCGNQLFSLTLPDLHKNWQIKPDWAVCFSVHLFQETYIVHGELSISRINKMGNILWDFGGSDIFVCLYEGIPFEMHEDHIALTDFNGSKYKIDYNGQSISYEPSDYHQQKPITVLLKPWWKFW